MNTFKKINMVLIAWLLLMGRFGRADLPSPLSLEKAISLSQERFPSIKSSAFKARAGKMKMWATILGLTPTGTVSKTFTQNSNESMAPLISNSSINNNSDSNNPRGLPTPFNYPFAYGFNVTFFDGGVTLFNIFGQNAAYKGLKAAEEITRNSVAQQVVQAYVTVAATNEQVAFYRDLVNKITDLKRGAAPELIGRYNDAIFKAQLRLNSILTVIQSQSQIALIELTDPDDPFQTPPTLSESLGQLVVKLEVPTDVHSALTAMKANNPSIHQAEANISTAKFTTASTAAAMAQIKGSYSSTSSIISTSQTASTGSVDVHEYYSTTGLTLSGGLNLSGIPNILGALDTQHGVEEDLKTAVITQRTSIIQAYGSLQPQTTASLSLEKIWEGHSSRIENNVTEYQTISRQISDNLSGSKPKVTIDDNNNFRVLTDIEDAELSALAAQSTIVLAEAQIKAVIGNLYQLK